MTAAHNQHDGAAAAKRSTRPRGAWRYVEWALWGLLGVLIAAAAVAAVFTLLLPDVWKAHTAANAFTIAGAGGEPQRVVWQNPRLLPGAVNDVPQNLSGTVSPDGKLLVFARAGPRGDSDLFLSRRDGGRWGRPQPIAALNTDANESTPRWAGEGNLLMFASDRTGTMGGYDLWVSVLTDDGWGQPANLGPRVNSEFNERGCCFRPGTRELYFASDRPRQDMLTRDRRLYWEALRQGFEPSNHDIFAADDVVLPRTANPLRDSRYRESVIVDLGGSPETERAVKAALEWFTRTQEADGHWDMAKQGGMGGQDIAGTSMAILCYLGWGARPDQDGEYRQAVRRAVEWLLAIGRKNEGNFCTGVDRGMYGHGAATIALGELVQVTGDAGAKDVLAKAVKVILRSQDRQLGGWRYTDRPQMADTSVVGWQALALRSARLAGVEVPEESFQLVGRWLNHVASGKAHGLYGYQDAKPRLALTAEGMFVRQILGASSEEARQKESARYLVDNLPARGQRRRQQLNLYLVYYGCLAMYQQQGPEWTRWNDTVKPLLLAAQLADGNDAGAWECGQWKQSGRVVATAMAALALEVYYRYLPMYNTLWQGKAIEGLRKTTTRTVRELIPASKPAAVPISHTTPLIARWVEAVNSPFTEGGPCFSPAGDSLYFSSDRTARSLGGFDIYRGEIVGGTIQVPYNVGQPVSSESHEVCPELADGGREMIFASDRPRDGKTEPLLYHSRLRAVSPLESALAFLNSVKWWLLGLLGGLIVLVALALWFVRSADREHMGLLARCLVGSTAVHAAALILLSLYMLGAAMQRQGGSPNEIRIDADALASEKLALEIREQVTQLQPKPELLRVVSDREPMPLPDIPALNASPIAAVVADFKIAVSEAKVEVRQVAPPEPQVRPSPPVAALRPVSVTADVELEVRPAAAVVDKPARAKPAEGPVSPVAFTPGEAQATMARVDDKAMREPTPQAEAAIAAAETALTSADATWRTDRAGEVAAAMSAAAPPSARAGVRVSTSDVQLEMPAAAARAGQPGGTGAPQAAAEFSLGTPAAAGAGSPGGEAMRQPTAFVGGTPGTRGVGRGLVSADVAGTTGGAPRLQGPGDLITRRTPRLPVGDSLDLEAPADMKSNYFARQKENRKIVGRLGGSDETEAAVGRALDWFTRHQEPDGHWDMAKHGGRDGHDVAATAFALLCYYGWNARHNEEGPYQKPVAAGLKWLLAQMGRNGDLTGRASQGMYDQGIATMALAEAFGISGDSDLYEPVRRAAEFILKAQNAELGGWRYTPRSRDCDMSVVGWEVMGLTSARMAGIRVPQEAFDRAQKWIDSVSSGAKGGRYGYTESRNATHPMTAEGMFCQQIMGLKPTEPRMQESAEFLRMAFPTDREVNYYYWYYGCLALYQHGGPIWETWNDRMKKIFLSTQVRSGEEAGSWPPVGRYTAGKSGGGRVMSTAMSALSLEVYYRYLPMYRSVHTPPAATQPAATP